MVTTSNAFQKPTTISLEIYADNSLGSFNLGLSSPYTFTFNADLDTRTKRNS